MLKKEDQQSSKQSLTSVQINPNMPGIFLELFLGSAKVMAALITRVLGSSPNILLHPVLQDAGSCLPVPFYCPVSYTSNLIRLWQIRYAKHCSASRIINFVICFWNNSHTIFSSVFIDSKLLKPEGTWQFSMTTCLAVWPDCLDQQFQFQTSKHLSEI